MPKCIDCINYYEIGKPRQGICKADEYSVSNIEGDFLCEDYKPKDQLVSEIRTFSTGATRDTDASKPNYIKALSPIVLQGYVEYLGKHRILPDGSMRDWDNWKSGLPKEVCLESLGRHEIATWLLMQGFPAFDNHGSVTLEDSLYGIIFNASCILHDILKTKGEKCSEQP